jgi:hypothetical protein
LPPLQAAATASRASPAAPPGLSAYRGHRV